jgi:hypothetical protein
MEKTNKLIAEFMDLRSTGLSIYKPSEYKYHTSWDWLIPVIEKIQDKYLENPELDYWGFDEIRLAVPNIQQVHYLVVEFIKEYNDGLKK